MRSLVLAIAVLFSGLRVHGQTQPPAPVERRDAAALPESPQPSTHAQLRADEEWKKLIQGTHYTRPEVRIQAVGDPIHCDVDEVTEDEIFCTEHRANDGPFSSLFHPEEQYHVPRREIRDVRVVGRAMSTALGAGIGIGLGVGIGSINPASRADGGQAYGALLLGLLGAFVGHAIPMAGHPVYRQP
jgi:hypothetical protein